MICSIASGSAPAERLKSGGVLAVDGQQLRAGSAIAAMKTSPAETRHSLLASATPAALRRGANVGARPAAPTIAAMTQSAGSGGGLDQRVAGRRRAMPLPASASFSAA